MVYTCVCVCTVIISDRRILKTDHRWLRDISRLFKKVWMSGFAQKKIVWNKNEILSILKIIIMNKYKN